MGRFRILIGFVAIALSLPALAALGDKESGVENDVRALKASRRVLAPSTGAYRVHLLTSPTGLVREYVSPDGFVFAVTWSGQAHPDIKSLLGNFASELPATDSGAPRRRPLSVATSRLRLRRGGHMRDYHGRAYAPELVPPGVDVGSLP